MAGNNAFTDFIVLYVPYAIDMQHVGLTEELQRLVWGRL